MSRHPISRWLKHSLLPLKLCVAAPAQAHPGGLDANHCHVDSRTGLSHCHPVKKAFDSTKPARAGDDSVLFGPLAKVVDGDTLIVKIQGAEMHFRLAGIDAPESDQPFGDKASRELARIIGNQLCVLAIVEPDAYSRTVAHLWIGDTYVNAEMVTRGMAWFESNYVWSDELFEFENKARDHMRGLWALPKEQRIEPWVWRRRRESFHAK